MKLYTYLKNHPEMAEVVVEDKNYYNEVYFYFDCVNPVSDYDKAMQILSKKITVVEEKNDGIIIGNLSGIIKKHLTAISDSCFNFPDELTDEDKMEYIMHNIKQYMAGNFIVSLVNCMV